MAQQFKVLIGSPVRQKFPILQEFLESLLRLERDSLQFAYYFVDDNAEPRSSILLKDFIARQEAGACVLDKPVDLPQAYACDETTHHWVEADMWRVGSLKDRMIAHARAINVDALFLVDSDLVLHPRTIKQLVAADRDIISNVFWTRWQPEAPPLPQVWWSGAYNQYEHTADEVLTEHEIASRHRDFIAKLHRPGTYEVGGLGACTLIRRAALKNGVSYARVPGLDLWGEDRHFCARARDLGFTLWVDTHYPAYHIYRESDLAGVQAFKWS